MADRVTFFLGDAVGDLADNIGHELGRLAGRLRDWLANAARPVNGVRLHSADGAEFSGLIVCDHNHVVAMLAVRHAPVAQLRQAAVSPQGRYRNPDPYLDEGPWRDDGEVPFWHR